MDAFHCIAVVVVVVVVVVAAAAAAAEVIQRQMSCRILPAPNVNHPSSPC
jgi:hypothetical protein